jgi:hypothetical protein
MSVVDKRKRSIMPENLVGDSAVEPWTSKNLVPNRVLSLAILAEQVEVNLNRDASAA